MVNHKEKFYVAIFLVLLLSSLFLTAGNTNAQEVIAPKLERDTLLSTAREYINSIRFCALVTVDSAGYPHVRTMDPFKPDDNMEIWLGTNRYSRKVKEIRNNPKVALYYAGNKGVGYVSIIGHASIVDDSTQKVVFWKNEWKNFYDKKRENFILIKVVPIRLEVLNYKEGILGNKKTWITPAVDFKNR